MVPCCRLGGGRIVVVVHTRLWRRLGQSGGEVHAVSRRWRENGASPVPSNPRSDHQSVHEPRFVILSLRPRLISTKIKVTFLPALGEDSPWPSHAIFMYVVGMLDECNPVQSQTHKHLVPMTILLWIINVCHIHRGKPDQPQL